MGTSSRFRVLILLGMLCTGLAGGVQPLVAQTSVEEEAVGVAQAAVVAMPVYASLCADGFEPHDDCLPWEGALVTVTSAGDGSYIGECTTVTFFETVAGCEVNVERGTSVVATISLDTLPAEYQMATAQIVHDVPAEGDVTGPMFLAVAVETEAELSPLPVYASICADVLPPNDDCTPWEGVVISAETSDGTYNDTCTTATFFETVAGCEISLPRGTNVTAYISEEQIPEGYELFVEVPTWDIPTEGDLESGPYFFLVPIEPEPELFPFPVAASICEDAVAPGDDCVPWEGVVVTMTSADGTFEATCTTATFIEFAAGCEVGVPFGSTVTASISDDQIPEGYELFSFDPTWDIPPGVPGGITGQPVFWLVPVDDTAPTPTPAPTAVPDKDKGEAPVKHLPSTGSGVDGNSTGMVLLAGMGVLMLASAGYTSLRKR